MRANRLACRAPPNTSWFTFQSGLPPRPQKPASERRPSAAEEWIRAADSRHTLKVDSMFSHWTGCTIETACGSLIVIVRASSARHIGSAIVRLFGDSQTDRNIGEAQDRFIGGDCRRRWRSSTRGHRASAGAIAPLRGSDRLRGVAASSPLIPSRRVPRRATRRTRAAQRAL